MVEWRSVAGRDELGNDFEVKVQLECHATKTEKAQAKLLPKSRRTGPWPARFREKRFVWEIY
jgi:hypothetical protein